MRDAIRIAIAQTNPTVGALHLNADTVRMIRDDAAAQGADLVVFSELIMSGYPPEDLVLRKSFLEAVKKQVYLLANETNDGGPAVLIGAPWGGVDACYNAVLLLDGGDVTHTRCKHHLPNYGVFDEQRVFQAGAIQGPINFHGVCLGVMICEDMWFDDVSETLKESGSEILIVINGSPFELDKNEIRLNHAVARVSETGLPLIYVHQVGGQDDLVFDGGSFVLNADRSIAAQLEWWKPDLIVTSWQRSQDTTWVCELTQLAQPKSRLENIYQAMVLGLRDYVNKNNFPGVILGLSGGVDSALSAAVAVDALGSDRVHCVMMPSPYTSRESVGDSEELVRLTGVEFDTIGIQEAMDAYSSMLAKLFAGTRPDVTEENIQSRARGMLLMAISNKFGKIVLSTGNKSEMSVGYATLYGDMCGGYSVLKDLYKTTVYEVCRWRNINFPKGALGPTGKVIPEQIITKAPTAELRPNQTDQDSLPPYSVLDGVLKGLIEGEKSIDEIAADGYTRETVQKVWQLLKNAEYKRRQAPPGVKVTHVSFGRDRRYPVMNAFNGNGINEQGT